MINIFKTQPAGIGERDELNGRGKNYTYIYIYIYRTIKIKMERLAGGRLENIRAITT